VNRTLILAAALLVAAPLAAQSDPLVAEVRAWRRANAVAVLREFRDLLAIPNVASDSANIRRNADALVAMLARRGVTARRLESPGSPPAVYGELRVPGATRTVMLYAHYDGQPVRAIEWKTNAWEPVFLGGRIEDAAPDITLEQAAADPTGMARVYARSASDDKGAIIAMLAALDALRAAGRSPGATLKFFFEGEEEAGSSHLRAMLTAHRALLAADLWLFGDGPRHQSGRMQVVHGVRGVTGVTLTAYGPVRPLHSGHYGNWAPNPAVRLARFLATLRDDDARILIPGFHDDVRRLTRADSTALAAVPAVDSALAHELALGDREMDVPLAEAILAPALNVRGFAAGGVGAGATNAVPTVARASIDFRLVPDQTPARVRDLLERHARTQGWHVTDREPTLDERRRHAKVLGMDWGEGGYAAQRTALDHPLAVEVSALVDGAVAGGALRVPTLGGSLPLSVFAEVLRVPLLTIPIANYDNSQHAPNENLRMKELWEGIEIWASVLAGIGRGAVVP
jgi:acetylornithine deacetylase/succinyl-diaminopimelate desuccinylase-like protein